MRSNLIGYIVLLFTLLSLEPHISKAQSTIGQTFASLFFLDGKNIVENTEFELGLDDIIRFDAYELMPGSSVEVKVVGQGVKSFQESYPSNQRGEVKTNFFFPKAKGKLTITVRFTTKNGSLEQIRFYLKPSY